MAKTLRTPRWIFVLFAALTGFASGAFAQQKDSAGLRCESFLRALPIFQHPQVREAAAKPDASLMDVLENVDALAAMDNAEAQYAIGRMQQTGACAEPNPSGALVYFTRAAENGHRPSQELLANAYYLGKRAPGANGLNVAPDSMRAYMWYRVLGNETAADQVRRRLTTPEITEADGLAREQLQKQAAKKQK